MPISTNFVADLQQELQRKEAEKEMLVDQLALLDVQIDNYDAIIENMDRSILPLIDEINVAISSVKSAYDNRISIGCKSNLYWELISTRTYRYGVGLTSSITYSTYQVKKNPSVQTNYSNWGAKYYRRPQNQDYGSNIIKEFTGTIGLGQTNLAVTSIGGTFGVLIGDTITDSITSPTVFNPVSLPSVVGFGTSSITINQVNFGGVIAFGSTVIAHTGIGTTVGINIGDTIALTGILPVGTTIVGFGTTSYSVEFWNNTTSQFISSSVTTNSLVISASAIGVTTNGTFTVGIQSAYPSFFLSTSSISTGSSTIFTVIRTTQSVLTEFDLTNNPLDPVTIAIMSNNTVGLGHTLVRVNNGSPSGPFQWRELLGADLSPEPACGNSYVTYYPGNNSWPLSVTYSYGVGGAFISSSTSYAAEGYTVSIGGTIFSSGISYASVSSLNPSVSACNAAAAAITSAETSRDTIIARNQPIIDSVITKSSVLRRLRDKLESSAFSMLQGKVYTEAEINRISNDLDTIRGTDFSQYEPTTFRNQNRFSSSTVGIAST